MDNNNKLSIISVKPGDKIPPGFIKMTRSIKRKNKKIVKEAVEYLAEQEIKKEQEVEKENELK